MDEFGQFGLERALLRMVNELEKSEELERVKNLKELISIYSALKNVVCTEYYPQIEKLYPWYTDHGKKHVESIMMVLGELLEQSIGRINEMELFVLICSCIFHDTGMTKSRESHASEVISIIKDMGLMIPDISVRRQINEIARAHTSRIDLKDIRLLDSCTFNNTKYKISTRALAALLRFADDISETRYRIIPDMLVKGLVPTENEIFWQYAYIIESVEVCASDMKCSIKMIIPQSLLVKSFFMSNGSEKVFFEYVLERLEKSNKERITCSIEFRNIVLISAFDMEICVMSDDLYQEIELLRFEINEDYCYTRSLKESFFEKNPDWRIDELKKRYIKEVQ